MLRAFWFDGDAFNRDNVALFLAQPNSQFQRATLFSAKYVSMEKVDPSPCVDEWPSAD